MRRWIVAALAAVVLLTGGWYYASPNWTLDRMRAAAQAGDADRLASYVDFPSLQASMRQELKRQAARQFAGRAGDPRAARSAALADRLIDGVVRVALTPDALQRLFVAGAARRGSPTSGLDLSSDRLDIDREGLNTFYVRGHGQQQGGLEFTRTGLGWRLTALRFPPEQS